MNLLSRRSVLAIAAVVDVALHSRSAPVAARDLAARHKLPPRHLETLHQGLVRAKILGRVLPRAAGRLRVGARAPTHHGGRDRARRDVAQHRRSARSPRQLGADRARDRSGRGQGGRKLSRPSRFDHRRRTNKCARWPRKPMCSTTRRRPVILRSNAGLCPPLPTVRSQPVRRHACRLRLSANGTETGPEWAGPCSP